MGEIIRMIVVLSLICGLSGLTLASVRQATSERIELQVMTYVQAPAIEQVFGSYDNDPLKDRKSFAVPGRDDELTVFPIKKNGRLSAVAFEVFGKGYGGDVGVMVGFDLDAGTLAGIGITTMKETPGLGARVAEPGFTRQFTGHGMDNVELTKNGGDIDAVSGATISSTASVTAINRAVELFRSLKPEIQNAWAS